MIYTQVKFTNLSPEERDLLIAVLSDYGYEGFEEDGNDLLAYVSTDKFEADPLSDLNKRFNLSCQVSAMPETNWNSVWESNFSPVTVEDFCSIRAAFHEPVGNVLHEILITPKMSFGTGHHATTFMMVKEMRTIPFEGKNALDFGTGTGILAILAKKLGAAEVTAIDNDDYSIENASENINTNNCGPIKLIKTDHAATQEKYDIILANITRNVILDNFEYFMRSLNKPGTLLLSGLLKEDKSPIIMKADEFNLRLENVLEKDQWLCIKLTRN